MDKRVTPIPALHLLQLRFKTLTALQGLPIYHGPMWNALFRDLLRPHLPSGIPLDEAGIHLNPIETRLVNCDPDDPMHLGLIFPPQHAPAVCAALNDFNRFEADHGRLRPGETITLESATCRITGRDLPADRISPDRLAILDEKALAPEVAALSALERFELVFYAPLRLPRPEGNKTPGHTLCDVPFFLASTDQGNQAVQHLLACLSGNGNSAASTALTIERGALFMLDNTYGRFKTPLGGVTGRLMLQGVPTHPEAHLLALGQYIGLGKNRTFGLGFYQIPELDAHRTIRPLTRARTLLARAFTPECLHAACERLTNTKPGPDGLSVEDLRKSGDELFHRICAEITQNRYTPGTGVKGWLPKKSGGYRQITVYNVADRMVHRAAADELQPIVEAFLSSAAWAYRRGLNRKGAAKALQEAMAEGFNCGLKADIEAFFDSVNLTQMAQALKALMPFDPLPGFIMALLQSGETQNNSGLPQGSPLSPVLSNLYLDRFDRQLTAQGMRMIRYGDDFVALFQDDGFEDGKNKIVTALSALDLSLQEEKNVKVMHGQSIPFLGLLVSASRVRNLPPQDSDDWLPLFTDQWRAGLPVYLTLLCRGAYSSGAELVVVKDNDTEEKIPWQRISRIIIVGRSKVSGGLVYRAAKEQIPLTYLDIMGRAISQLTPQRLAPPDMLAMQRERFQDPHFCLELSRVIAAAKIHNSQVLLRRSGCPTPVLKTIAEKVLGAGSLESLRGIEGAASRIYFRQMAKLVSPFEFNGRKYHPPDGPVNVMLSFGYTLLRQRLEAVLLDRGFDARMAFNHRSRGRHMALASDLMENLRFMVDRMVLALIRRREIQPQHFSQFEKSGVSIPKLEGEGFRRFVYRFEDSMARQFTHEGAQISYNQYLDAMVDGFLRTLRLDITFKPLRIK